VIAACKRHGAPPPVFEERQGFLIVTFRLPDAADAAPAMRSQSAGSGEKNSGKTREKTREKVLGLLRKDRTLTTAGLAERLGITDQGVEWQLKRLRQDGLLHPIRADTGRCWRRRGRGDLLSVNCVL
jgi:ATP-dependent DNA helicase RecG